MALSTLMGSGAAHAVPTQAPATEALTVGQGPLSKSALQSAFDVAGAAAVAAEQARIAAAAEAARIAAEEEAARQAAEAEAARAAAATRKAQQSATASNSRSSGNNSAPAQSPSGGSAVAEAAPDEAPTYNGGGVVAAAMSRVGSAYVRGGSGPSSFDCSGLTMWAYRQVGISLPHFSGAQMAAGRPVSIDSMQPGDLMFWGSGGGRHVAMYIGGGQVVHATNPRSGVKVGTYQYEMNRGDFAGVRRYL